MNGTIVPGADKSCILPVGCHPFIITESYVSYRTAKVKSYADIFNGLKKGKYISKEAFSEKDIREIQTGAKKTLHLPEKLKRFFTYFD
ncbi:MAG: hypothetical protein LBU99_01360 [Spirochaetaceae bacterium]|nr:hypothetical protein [Spirochaetaceae bacterium]